MKEIVYGGMGKEEFHQAQEIEKQLQQQDLLMEQTRDRKNQLEAYVYDIRNKVSLSYFLLDLSLLQTYCNTIALASPLLG